MSKHTPEPCCKEVWHSSIQRRLPCSRNGGVTRDGKSYCAQHDPVKIKKEEAKRESANERHWQQIERASLCVRVCEPFKTSDLESGIIGEMVELLRESILTLESCAETLEINEKNDPLKIFAGEIERIRKLLSKIEVSDEDN